MKSIRMLPTAALVATCLAFSGLTSAPSLAAVGESPIGTYTGRLVNLTPIFPRHSTTTLTLRLKRLTTAEEAQKMADVLRRKGEVALQDELWKQEAGSLQIDGHVGLPVAAALWSEDEAGGHLVLVINRPISLREFWNMSRSKDYPFTIVELDLASDGHGSGEMVAAAKIDITKDSTVQIESLGVIPLRILRLQRESS